MSVYKALAVFCFLYLVSGVDFSHARPLYTRLEVRAGSKLVIPCVVTTDRLSGASSVGIDWGMTPEGGGPFSPIFHRDLTNLLKNRGERFHLHVTRSDEEDCTLVISPVLPRDSGTYEVRLTVDDVRYHPFQKVIIHVTDPTSTETADTKTFREHQRNLKIQRETPSVTSTETDDSKTDREDQRNLEINKETPSVTSTEEVPKMSPTVTTKETSTYDTGKPVFDPDVKFIAKTYYQMQKNGLLPYVCVAVGVVVLGLIISIATACCFGKKYCKRRREWDRIKRMEEGLLEEQVETPATQVETPATLVVPPATQVVPPATQVVPPATQVVPPATQEFLPRARTKFPLEDLPLVQRGTYMTEGVHYELMREGEGKEVPTKTKIMKQTPIIKTKQVISPIEVNVD